MAGIINSRACVQVLAISIYLAFALFVQVIAHIIAHITPQGTPVAVTRDIVYDSTLSASPERTYAKYAAVDGTPTRVVEPAAEVPAPLMRRSEWHTADEGTH